MVAVGIPVVVISVLLVIVLSITLLVFSLRD